MISLRLRLTLAFALIFALTLFVSASALQRWSVMQAEQDTADLLKGAAARLALEAQKTKVFTLADFVARGQAFSDEPLSAALLGPDGQAIDQTGHALPAKESLLANWRTRTVLVNRRTYILGVPWNQTWAALEHQKRDLFYVSAGLWSVACLAAWVLVGQTLHPLSRLSAQALQRSQSGDDRQLVASSSDREIKDLVSTLNLLLQTVHNSVAARGRFYAAASHELRTPLQGLLGHIDLALTRPRSPEEYQAVLSEARLQGTRLKELISALLTLNQLETNNRLPDLDLDLGQVLEARISMMNPENRARVFLEAGDCPVRCAPAYAEILIGNLLENALKYSLPDSQVQVGISRSELTVSNSCSDTAHLNPEKLFEAFYRPDRSRSSQTGGNGLGLALCKAIADAQHWDIKLAVEAQRVTATVRFP